MLYHGQWGEFKIKKATLCFHSFFFDEESNYRNRMKQGLGGTKLSVELYVKRQNRNSCPMGPESRILGTHFRYPKSEWFLKKWFRKIGKFHRKKLVADTRLFWKSLFDKRP